MGWSTELFCNISFNRETFNSKEEVESKYDDLTELIHGCEQELRDLALITEPSKFMDSNETDSYFFVVNKVKECLENLREYTIDRYKLYLLLYNWDNCHNNEGLAIYPPDDVDWNTAYLHGDFVRSTKYPTDKDLM